MNQQKELEKLIRESDSPVLEPLRNLFIFMDMLNDNYEKEFGEKSPYWENRYEESSKK